MVVLALIAAGVIYARPNAQTNEFQLFVVQARTDLEILATEFLGADTRPEQWTNNLDLESDKLVVDLWFDNELLADEIYGGGQRPPGWFGATSPQQPILARNVRHDLELAADTVYGPDTRPEGWNGAAQVFRCDRTLQNVLQMLSQFYELEPNTAQSVLDYCAAVRDELKSELLRVAYESEITETEIAPLGVALRGDLERLANEELGVDTRPPAWIGFLNEDSPSIIPDAAADLERLADSVLGGDGSRPEGWEDYLQTSLVLSYYNIRYNLELLADLALGEGVRPSGWQGASALERCDTIDQGLVFLAQINYAFVVDQELVTSSNFCDVVAFTANSYVENPPAEVIEELNSDDTRYQAESNFAFAYLDVSALQYMGVMPGGTVFRAWYRNFNESNMMFVSGENFALFIDSRFTTMDPDVFRTLPTLEGVRPLTFCDAGWCNGPGPTPTPTGVGPLLALIQQSTPPATTDPGTINQGGKQEVTFENVRVTYLADDAVTGTARVTLELCATPQQIACEPVISAFDETLGINKPVLQQFNGLNVYEFRYGFSDAVVLESATRIALSVWISDPTIR
ncbi:MAG: hypothetical protein OHK0046_16340 [Anaerolineae bacterium]